MGLFMKLFKTLLLAMTSGIVVYTGITGSNHGWNLFQIFFTDMASFNWPGQFNFDFTCMLAFSGLWTAWRNNFSFTGLILGFLGFVGGTMFLAPYLLYLTFKTKGDMKEILLGTHYYSK